MSKRLIFIVTSVALISAGFFSYFQTHVIPQFEKKTIYVSEEQWREAREKVRKEAERKTVKIASESRLVANPGQYLPPGKNYARVITPAPIYASLDAASRGQYFTMQESDIAWVNVKDNAFLEGKIFYRVSWGWGIEGWISGEALIFNPILSRLKGVEIGNRLGEHLAMVYVGGLNVRSSPGDVDEKTLVGMLGKYDLISVKEKKSVKGDVWYKIYDRQWVHSGYVRNLIPGKRPAGVGPGEKWIEVNLSEQTIFAHEGDRPVFGTLTSTGRFQHDTIVGLFWPRVKARSAPMQSVEFSYDFSSVPWIYYFMGDYAWHGTYWHDNFGRVQSSGCVNLSPHDAHWFFHWSEPNLPLERKEAYPSPGRATWVHIHY